MKALPVLVLVLLATLGFIGYRMSTRPVLVVRNELAFPVRVALLGHDTLLPAGSVLERVVSREQPVAVRWEMEPPRTAGRLPVGAAIAGATTVGGSDGRLPVIITPSVNGAPLFAPLITNATGVPLRVRVNAGLQGSQDCPCEVPVGANRMPIGYYPLYQNSSVEVRDSLGRRATFSDLGPAVTERSGTVGLRFNAGDLK
ncbi:MAG TPA: hypothetical protein VFS94_00280 [Gemmatimonadales bacterium]|nr:hypothetical protein [Gemmatimonadales bacterium]